MSDRLQDAIRACRRDVMDAAEQKLERPLTETERLAIEGITSLMMLDSCCQSFSSPAYTAAQVQADLDHFARHTPKV